MATCGEAMVAALEAHGVETVFGIPGTHTLALHGPLAESSIRHIAPKHEQGGGYAADGYARASGKPGVCLVTTGPGITNTMTAAATAFHDSMPMLILSPGMPTDIEGEDAGFLHQLKDQSGAMGSIVARSRRVGSAAQAVVAIDEAFASFQTERPRPIHLEVPLDVLETDETDREANTSGTRFSARPPEAAAVERAIELLAGSRSPMLLLGGGSVQAAAAARALAEALGAVVVTTVNGKGVLPESHPLTIGASLRLLPAREALEAADVVLAVGTEIAESDLWTRRLQPRGHLIRVDIDPGQIDKNARADTVVLGDSVATLEALAAGLPPRGDRGGAGRAAVLRAAVADLVERDGSEYALLHRVLRETLAADAIVTGDSSRVSYYGSVHQFPVDRPRRFLYPVGYATLGYSVPAAIGAKLSSPDSQVVAIDGDGGFLFTATEIATAAELRLPLPVVVFDDGGYGEIREQMLERGATPIGVEIAGADFPALSEALGGRGEWISYAEAPLAAALESALEHPGPTLIAIDQRTGAG